MAFHPYPQLIPRVFNPGGFGPPRPLTAASPWPWVDHSASGPHPATTLPKDRNALFGLAFATATPPGLTSPRNVTRRLILQKARHHHPRQPRKVTEASALTACRHTVSGTLSLPSRGTFHLSLTVLVRYRSPGSIQAYRVVPADSQHIPRARCYSGIMTTTRVMFSRTGLSPTTAAHPRNVPLTPHTGRQRSGRTPTPQPHNPASATPAEYHTNTV